VGWRTLLAVDAPDADALAEEGLPVFLAFDLLHQDGVDLRSLPPFGAQARAQPSVPPVAHALFKQAETFLDGEVVFDHCNKFGFEGVVSKRRVSGYASGPSRHWVKSKCPDWKRDNAERWKIFNQPEQTECERARVRGARNSPACESSWA
jgi:ATP-dependent DNA ligase